MNIYLEKDLLENSVTKNILSIYKNANVLLIDNYKNIFDKSISYNTKKSIIIAKVWNAILKAPDWYWHNDDGYFIKNSINCIYDCKYCYLKGAFKNDIPVFFVNYEDIFNQIENIVKSHPEKEFWFYSSDYSDNLAVDNLSNFTKEFVPFFDSLSNAKMEIRTKSVNINNLLSIKPSKNVEIAFSLNPSEIIDLYEQKTTSLDMRIKAINKLIEKWWNVGIRFIPLIEIKNYKSIYKNFLDYLIEHINFDDISSIFIWGLLYTQKDYNKMLKKEPHLDLLYNLHKDEDGFYRENREVRNIFYNLFDEILKNNKCNRCLDN